MVGLAGLPDTLVRKLVAALLQLRLDIFIFRNDGGEGVDDREEELAVFGGRPGGHCGSGLETSGVV